MKRFFVMLLACLMLLSVVPFSVFAEEADHEHGTEQCPGKDVDHTLENATSVTELDKVQGSCGGYSYTVYQCNVCDELFADDFVKTGSDEHAWEVTSEKVEPTCTETGKEAVETCANCGAVKGGEVIPAAHKLDENGACTECDYVTDPDCEHATLDAESATLIQAPTCGVAGKMQYTCADCEAIVVVEIEALGHDEDNLVSSEEVKPDCVNDGVKAHDTCADCGKFFIDGVEVTAEDLVIEALDHDMNDAVVTKPTCTEPGLSTATCKRCDYKEEEVLPPAHTWSEQASVTDPTCTRPGMAYDFCVICGHYDNVAVAPALGHGPEEIWDEENGKFDWEKFNWEDYATAEELEAIKNALCNQEDLTVSYTCYKCGEIIEFVVVPAVAHEYEEVVEDATCSTVKKVWNVCTVCGEKVLKSEGTEFDSDNHNFEWLWINEPVNCGEGNKILYCANCNVTEGDPVYVPAGHSLIVNVIKAPSCFEKGLTNYTCENCNFDETVETEMLDHEYEEEGTFHAATCKHAAYTAYACKTEGCTALHIVTHEDQPQLDFDWEKKFETLEEAQDAHEHSEFVEFSVISGSCTEQGLIIYTCTLCEKNVLVIKAGTGEGHTRPAGSFTCTDAFTCTVCNTPVEGGEHTGETVLVAPTCGKNGISYCTDCHTIYETSKHEGGLVIEIIWGTGATCATTGLTIGSKCGICGEIIVEQEVIPTLPHNYTNVNAELSVDVDCDVDGYSFMECADCGARLIVDYKFASGHWYIDGETEVELVPDCDAECICGAETEEDCVCRVCSICGDTIERHSYAEPNVVDPTCTEEGYTITVCTECGHYIIEEASIVEPLGHDIVAVEGSILPTYKPGYIYGECSRCGLEAEEAVEAEFDMGLTIEIDNAVVAGAGFSDSSLVAVKINLNSIKEVGIWSINFNLNYNSDKFTYVNTEFVSEAFDGFTKAVDNGTFVAIGATTANDANKELVDAIINAEDEAFAVVYFKVNNAIADGVTESVVIDNPFAIDETFALNKTNEEVTVWGQTETEIAIEKFMDYNKDGVVNAVDYKFAWEIISGTVDVIYDVTLDVDKDGQILENDFFAIFSYILGDAEYAYEVLVDRVVEAA